MDTDVLLKRRNLAFGRGAELFYSQPIELVRGEGAYLYDRHGQKYVDLYNNVPCVGHGNTAVAEAMATQQQTLNVHSRYLHESILSFAERLCATHHAGIDSVVFSCTGTEANEVALMMARAATDGQGIICTDQAYHGNSTEVRRLNHCSAQTGDIRSVPFPDLFRFGLQLFIQRHFWINESQFWNQRHQVSQHRDRQRQSEFFSARRSSPGA